MNIVVELKDNHGKMIVYPVDQHAHAFAKIARNQVLTDDVIKLIKSLGFQVSVHNGTVKL